MQNTVINRTSAAAALQGVTYRKMYYMRSMYTRTGPVNDFESRMCAAFGGTI